MKNYSTLIKDDVVIPINWQHII